MARLNQQRLAAALAVLDQYAAPKPTTTAGAISPPYAPYYGDVSRGGGGLSAGDIFGGIGNVLTTPLAAVTSTLHNFPETFGALGFLEQQRKRGATRHSLGDWFQQIYHPQKRLYTADLLFGNEAKGLPPTDLASHITNPLQRAALGLAGDIALDPLSYVGGVGIARSGAKRVAEEVAQQGSKLASAARLAGDADRASEILARAKEATAAARRLGVSGLSKEQAAEFLGNRGGRGLAFLGQKIPGTDIGPLAKIGETYHRALAKAGDIYYGTLPGRALESARALTIAARSGNPETAYRAVSTGLERGLVRREAEHLGTITEQTWNSLTKNLSGDEMQLLPHALQGDAAAIAALGGKHEPIAAFQEELLRQGKQEGLNFRGVEDWAARRIDPTGQKVLREAGLMSKKGVFNPTGFASEVARKWKPGEEITFLGKKFVAKNEAEIGQQATRIAKEKLAAVDPKLAEQFGEFFNPDYNAVMRQYIRGWSRRVAEARGAQRLFDAGIGSTVERETVQSPRAAKKAAKLQVALDALTGSTAGLEAKTSRAETLSQKAQRDLLTQRSRQLQAQIDALLPQAPPTVTAAPSVAPKLVTSNVMVARDEMSHFIARHNPEMSPNEVNATADHFFPPIGPNGEPIADTVAIRKYVAAHREPIGVVIDMANDATKAASRAPQEIAADVAELQRKQVEIGTMLSAGTKLPASAMDHLGEMHDAIQQGIGWGKVQESGLAKADSHIAAVAAYERTAANARLRLAETQQKALSYETKLSKLSNKTVDRIVDAAKHAMQTEIKRGIGTPDEVAHWLVDAERLVTPEGLRNALKHWDSVVGWIKDYQIAYPGFHIRNALGGIFNNAEYGVKVGSYRDLLGLWRRAARGRLTEADKPLWDAVQRVVGKGQIGEESLFGRGAAHIMSGGLNSINPFSRGNVAIKASRWSGEQVEFFLRGSLAMDVFKKGGSLEDAVAAINKFHFDYSDLSKFEQGLRHVVPFFTWTRRNLPLQVEQLVKNPKIAARFFETKNEVEAQSSPDAIVPGYFGDLNAIRLPFESGGGHVYAAPDLPLRELPRFLNSPGGGTVEELAGMLSPVVKTPLETFLGRQFFKRQPIEGSKFVPVPSPIEFVPGLVPALRGLGVVRERDGKLFMSERDAYQVGQYVPLIGTLRRLYPKEDRYAHRRMTSWLSWFGIGTRTNTTEEQQKVVRAREFAKRDEKRREAALRKAAGT